MAIAWGDWEYASGNGMRIGLEAFVSEVTNASTDVTFYIKVYTQNQYPFSSDSQNLDFDDDLEPLPDVPFTNNEGTSPTYRTTVTYVHTYTTYGSSPGDLEFTSELDGGAHGITPKSTIMGAIPPRPYSLPAAPTSVTMTRVSDSQVNLNWTRNSTASGFYSNQVLEWRRWVGAAGWTAWSSKYALPGTASSVSVVGFSAGIVYQIRLRAENSTGPSDWAESNVVYMTPTAPTVLSSKRNAADTAITTTWQDNHYTYGGVGTWTIQRSVAGGAYADLQTGIARTTTAWTDSSPGTGTNRYRVAAVVGGLTSAWSTGPLVTAAVPPLAPTLLSPDGTYSDLVNDPVTLTWQHNPSTDYADQSWIYIAYSSDGGSSWTPLPGASPLSLTGNAFVVAAGTLTNGVTYLWRIATIGVVSASWSPYSTPATLAGSTTPTATITVPGATVLTSPIHVEWTYAQAEMVAQYAFIARLYSATGDILEEIVRYTADTFVDFTYIVVNGESYDIYIGVASAHGLWSSYDYVSTTFILYPPAAVTTSGTYDPCSGTVTLTLAAEAAVPGVTLDVVSATVERRTPDSEWVILATGLLLPTSYVDGLPATHGDNEYRVIALSAAPSTAINPTVTVEGTDGTTSTAGVDPLWVWLSYGDVFEFDLRVHGDLSISETSGRERTVRHFLGRSDPVAFLGQNTAREVSVSGALSYDRRCPLTSTDDCRYDSTPAQWRQAGSDAELVCYRDYTGRRLFGVLSDVKVTDDAWPGRSSVSFTVTQVDYLERYVQMVVG